MPSLDLDAHFDIDDPNYDLDGFFVGTLVDKGAPVFIAARMNRSIRSMSAPDIDHAIRGDAGFARVR